MKKILYILTIFLAGLLMFSCEKWIDPDVNLSENSPTDVPLALLLPSTQASLFYVLGGDHSRAASIWMQHQAGVDRQAGSFDVYIYNESDCNNLYNTLSATVMKNLKVMKQKSIDQNSPHYEGVVNILTAFTLGEMTDIWGDVPYTEAFQADLTNNKTPKYDSQQELYGMMDALLVEAIAKLQAPTSVFTPTATADKNYAGVRDRWRRLAWTLRLRYALNQAKRSGYAAANAILTNPDAIFLSANADDFQFKFGTSAVERGPRYNFESSRGDIRAGAHLVNMMNATSDPRRPMYFTQVSGAYVGSAAGQNLTAASRLGTFYGAMDAIVPTVTYVEFLFMSAELKFRASNLIGAAQDYNAAVTASLAKHGATDAAWLAINAIETDATITLQKIMTGKYVGLYLQTQVWSDWRRTGLPTLTLATNAAETQIPRRYPYPLNERLYNGNNMPSGLTLTDRVWWDMP
jgi:hypothetical protein